MKGPSQEAVWFVRRRDSVQARQTEDAFQTWLAADPENALRYGQCELMWERSGELAQDGDVARWLGELDAAASQSGTQGGPAVAAVGRARKPRRWTGWAVAAAVTIVITAAVSFQWLRAPVYQTAPGEQRDVRLPDGSRMTLNTATRVVVRYDGHARRIELTTGEAVFDVRKDPTRAFEVAAGAGVARAIGTRFAVSRGQDAVTVSVLEGIVEVVRRASPKEGGDDSRAARLVPALESGQAASVTNEGAVSNVGGADLRRILAWQDRKLDFESEPLDKAIAEVNRYATRRLTMSTPELAQVRVSGVFRIAELEGFVFALQESFGLRVIENNDEVLVLPPAPGARPASP